MLLDFFVFVYIILNFNLVQYNFVLLVIGFIDKYIYNYIIEKKKI